MEVNWENIVDFEVDTELVGETKCKNRLPWEIRRNDDILGDNILFIRRSHLGLILEFRIGKELD